MCEFPPDFDYESLVTENDRILKKLILEKYSEDTAFNAMEEYHFDDAGKSFSQYMDKVKKLLKKNLPEQDFIEEIQQLNFEEHLPIL